jgi:hypothetical protein
MDACASEERVRLGSQDVENASLADGSCATEADGIIVVNAVLHGLRRGGDSS